MDSRITTEMKHDECTKKGSRRGKRRSPRTDVWALVWSFQSGITYLHLIFIINNFNYKKIPSKTFKDLKFVLDIQLITCNLVSIHHLKQFQNHHVTHRRIKLFLMYSPAPSVSFIVLCTYWVELPPTDWLTDWLYGCESSVVECLVSDCAFERLAVRVVLSPGVVVFSGGRLLALWIGL